MPTDLDVLEQRLSHGFRDRNLLVRALTHRSFAFDQQHSPIGTLPDNEQLEFLGDSILGFLVSESLTQRHSAYPEGRLSMLKAHLVSAVRLHQVAQSLELGSFLQVGRSEEMSGGRQKKTILADALEAIIAAIYLDGGIDAARQFVVGHIVGVESPDSLSLEGQVNYKSTLQERAQASKLPQPTYTIAEQDGPGHARIFIVEAKVGKAYTSRGSGSTKKAASQQAAKAIVEQMNSVP